MLKEIEIRNGSISYAQSGHGSPIILLCGYGSSQVNWPREMIEKLEKKFEVFCPNYRFVGLSKANENEYSISLLAEDLEQFITGLNLKNISIFGFSMGGYVAQEIVLRKNIAVENLILCATKLGGAKGIPADNQLLQRIQPKDNSLEEEIESDLRLNFPDEDIEKFRSSQLERYKLRALADHFVSPETREKQRNAIGTWMSSFDQNKYDNYSKLNVKKTLILTGLKDIIMNFQNSIILSQHIRNSRVITFDKGGHGFLRQYPAEVANLICAAS